MNKATVICYNLLLEMSWFKFGRKSHMITENAQTKTLLSGHRREQSPRQSKKSDASANSAIIWVQKCLNLNYLFQRYMA